MLLSQKQMKDGLDPRKEQLIAMIRKDEEEMNTLRVRLLDNGLNAGQKPVLCFRSLSSS